MAAALLTWSRSRTADLTTAAAGSSATGAFSTQVESGKAVTKRLATRQDFAELWPGQLFSAQHRDRVDTHCVEHRWQGRQQRRYQDCQRWKRERRQAYRLHFVEQRLDVAHGPCTEPDTRDCSHDDHEEDVPCHQSRNAAALRTNRHANADFAPPLQNRVIEHAMQADPGEQQRDRREEH